jgi:hypothetical protein
MISYKNESFIESHTKNSIQSEQIDSNDLPLHIYKNHIVPENIKVPTAHRRRITLKDFIFYLEGERRNPLNNILLHKANMKLYNNQ